VSAYITITIIIIALISTAAMHGRRDLRAGYDGKPGGLIVAMASPSFCFGDDATFVCNFIEIVYKSFLVDKVHTNFKCVHLGNERF
jgi:hypothetical protein